MPGGPRGNGSVLSAGSGQVGLGPPTERGGKDTAEDRHADVTVYFRCNIFFFCFSYSFFDIAPLSYAFLRSKSSCPVVVVRTSVWVCDFAPPPPHPDTVVASTSAVMTAIIPGLFIVAPRVTSFVASRCSSLDTCTVTRPGQGCALNRTDLQYDSASDLVCWLLIWILMAWTSFTLLPKSFL